MAGDCILSTIPEGESSEGTFSDEGGWSDLLDRVPIETQAPGPMVPREPRLEEELLKEEGRLGQGFPNLGEEGGTVGRVFEEYPVDARAQAPQQLLPGLRLDGNLGGQEGDVDFQARKLLGSKRPKPGILECRGVGIGRDVLQQGPPCRGTPNAPPQSSSGLQGNEDSPRLLERRWVAA